MEIADVMAGQGYLAAGYEFVAMDDCWLAKDRDENGRLQPDPIRFPSGIKPLADYVLFIKYKQLTIYNSVLGFSLSYLCIFRSTSWD